MRLSVLPPLRLDRVDKSLTTSESLFVQALGLMRRYSKGHRIEIGSNFVTAVAEDEGKFDVGFVLSGHECIVSLGGWYDEFDDPRQGLRLIEEALLGQLRLRVELLAGKPSMWTVERQGQDGAWGEICKGGLFRLRLWRRVDVCYLRN